MKGIYSSGGSVANLVALGAARQWAFERLSINVVEDGIQKLVDFMPVVLAIAQQ